MFRKHLSLEGWLLADLLASSICNRILTQCISNSNKWHEVQSCLFESRQTVLKTVINSNEQIPPDSFAVHASEKHFTSLHCHPYCMLHVFLVNVYIVYTLQTFSAWYLAALSHLLNVKVVFLQVHRHHHHHMTKRWQPFCRSWSFCICSLLLKVSSMNCRAKIC